MYYIRLNGFAQKYIFTFLMDKSTQSINVLILFLVAFLFISCSDKNQEKNVNETESGQSLEFTGEVYFMKTETDTISTIKVAVADNNRLRSQGLMNVLTLPDDSGMLFIFSKEQPRSFWMANTPIPLDIIFIDSGMNIVRIHRNTRPYSQESIQSEEPAQFVVEVNAGYTLNHDIREGMKIEIDGVDL